MDSPLFAPTAPTAPPEDEINRAIEEASAPDAKLGRVLLATSVASQSGSVLSLEVCESEVGPVLVMSATGNGRKMHPIRLDRFQITALAAAIEGARSAVVDATLVRRAP